VPVRLVSAAVCALGAHALLYGTFRPGDGMHGYFGWYEPALALAALATLVLVRPVWLRTRNPIGETARRISTAAFVLLLVQESVERSLEAGRPAFAVLTPAQLLVLLVGIVASALLLAVTLRAGQAVAGRLLRGRTPRLHTGERWSVVTVRRRTTRPLAARFALRAPPLVAG
jgi:hypothetical protein